jgi:AcrR family transcriptional regulator
VAAAEEMKNRGVKFTMSDLARRLSLSKTSLYEHFSSKNDLVHSILVTALQDIKQQEDEVYNNTDLSPAEKIQALLRVMPKVFGPLNSQSLYDDLRNHYPAEWQLVNDFREEQLNQMTELILQSIEANALRPVNLAVFKQIVTSTMDALFNFRFLEENNMTLADALASLADIIVCGLLPPK